jgi:hypothetical protein
MSRWATVSSAPFELQAMHDEVYPACRRFVESDEVALCVPAAVTFPGNAFPLTVPFAFQGTERNHFAAKHCRVSAFVVSTHRVVTNRVPHGEVCHRRAQVSGHNHRPREFSCLVASNQRGSNIGQPRRKVRGWPDKKLR